MDGGDIVVKKIFELIHNHSDIEMIAISNKLIWAAKDFNDNKRITLETLEEIESIDSCFQNINIKYFKKIN